MPEVTRTPVRDERGVSAPVVSTRRMLLSLGLISAFGGLLIVGAFQIATPFIRANQERMLDKAVNTVLPGGVRKEVFGYLVDGVFPNPERAPFGERFYTVYDSAGVLKGLVLESTARGDSGVASIICGYEPERQNVTGVFVLESGETPGRGYPVGNWSSFNVPDGTVESRGLASMVDLILQRSLPRVLPYLETLRKAPS